VLLDTSSKKLFYNGSILWNLNRAYDVPVAVPRHGIALARLPQANGVIFAKPVPGNLLSTIPISPTLKTALAVLYAADRCTFICEIVKAFVSGARNIQIAGVSLR
jgi:hypothetical protein